MRGFSIGWGCDRQLHPACAVGGELLAELGKRARIQRGAHLAHQVQVIVQVVNGCQHGSQHLAAAVQVVQIRARKALAPARVPAHAARARAGVAGASRVDGAMVITMAGVAQFEVAKAREQRAVASIARGHDAIEHIHAASHAIDQVLGRAHAHQVARLVRGQTMWGVGHDVAHQFFGFTHGDAAHGITWEVHLNKRGQRFFAQVFEHAALHDAKQRIGVLQPLKLRFGSRRPAQAHFHGFTRLGLGRYRTRAALALPIRRAFVELHDDV